MPDWLIISLIVVLFLAAFWGGRWLNHRRNPGDGWLWSLTVLSALSLSLGFVFWTSSWSIVLLSAGAAVAFFLVGVESTTWRWAQHGRTGGGDRS